MTWVRLDDDFTEHPKILSLTDAAFRLHVRALCYCGHHLTDGFLPRGFVSMPRLAKEIVSAGLWEEVNGGYAIHDFLEYNKTRAEVEGEREQARERMSDVRANVQPNNNGSSATPVPIPVPLTPGSSYSRAFEAFWTAYPRKQGKRTAASAFARAIKRASVDEITQAACRFAADPNLPEERFIPHPTTWLNRDGWLEGPCPARSNGTASILAMADEMERRGL